MKRHLPQKNPVTKFKALELKLEGACLHILGPHEFVWNSMYLQIYSQIFSTERGKEQSVVDFNAFIWDLCIPHIGRNSRDRENKYEQTNQWVFIVSGTLMYTTAVLQRKFIQTLLLPPPPLSLPLSFLLSFFPVLLLLSHWCFGRSGRDPSLL